MKRWKRILALTSTLVLIAPTNILAEEIQLTDYRYENCMYGLYGYNFCNVSGDKNIFGDDNLKYDKSNNTISVNSIILKPDGTELFQQGKYDVSYSLLSSYIASTSMGFPQYEFLFTARDRATKEDCILDQYGNEVCRFYAGLLDLYSIDLTGPMIETVILDTRRIGLVDEIKINGKKYLIVGGSYFSHFGDNLSNYYGTVSLLIRESDWKVIINTTYNPALHPANLYISTDEQYLMIDGQEMYGPPDSGHRQPITARYYYDLEGNMIEKPEGAEFVRYLDTGEYLQINSDGIVTTDKINRNYTFKEKNIGGKNYYALFKELEEGETAADYIPEEQPSFWAVDTIRQATDAGLLYNNSNCRYKDNISRQDFAVLAVEAYCKSLGKEVDEYVSENNITLDFDKFEDTQNAYILLANKLGILSGTSDTTFSPDRGITRQEAAVMLNNMAELSGLSPNSEQVDFADDSYFATWAEDAIASISSIKNDKGIAIMGGTEVNKFSPWMTFSREQAYVTIYRLFEMLS